MYSSRVFQLVNERCAELPLTVAVRSLRWVSLVAGNVQDHRFPFRFVAAFFGFASVDAGRGPQARSSSVTSPAGTSTQSANAEQSLNAAALVFRQERMEALPTPEKAVRCHKAACGNSA